MSAGPEDVRAVYDRQAEVFDRLRENSRMEAGWIDRFVAAMGTGPEVLDLGCGSGEPVAGMLINRGCCVTGVDFAPEMLRLAAARWPGAAWIEADISDLDLGRDFDGIVAWHSFFHLSIPAQRQALPRVVAHLRPGGALMMTLGIEEGEVTGHVGDAPVYHGSLSAEEYRATLTGLGVEVLDFVFDDPTCGGANVLFARRGA